MRFFSKYVNEVLVGILLVTGLMVISSAVILTTGLNRVVVAYRANEAIPLAVPLISRQSNSYELSKYKELQNTMAADPLIKVLASADKLTISAVGVANEVSWRRAVSEIMALDRNLRVSKVCGSSTNACGGVSLIAEISGARQSFSIAR